MSTNYTLKNKGSVTFHDKDGKPVHYDKGEQVSAKELKQVPKRQQAFFEKVKAAESEKQEDLTLEETLDEDFTVEQLQDALQEAGADYKSDARKDDLIALYIEHVHED